MITVIRWELWRRRWLMLWWNVGVSAMVALTVLSYGAVRDQADELNKAFGDLSSGAGSFFGSADMFTPVGFMNSQLYYVTLPVLFIILAVTLSRSLLSKEETSHTLELLLARPISRTRLLTAKALSGLLVMFCIGLVSTVVTIVCAKLVSLEIGTSNLLAASLATILFSAAFGAVTLALSAFSAASQRLAAVGAVLLSIGSYIITSLGGLVDWLEPISKALPYYYYDSESILRGTIPVGFVTYIGALYIICIVLGIYGFRRRDIR